MNFFRRVLGTRRGLVAAAAKECKRRDILITRLIERKERFWLADCEFRSIEINIGMSWWPRVCKTPIMGSNPIVASGSQFRYIEMHDAGEPLSQGLFLYKSNAKFWICHLNSSRGKQISTFLVYGLLELSWFDFLQYNISSSEHYS